MAPRSALTWLRRLRVASWLLVFGLPAYWAATNSGLYRVFAEMQIDLFDDHMPLLSWALAFLIAGIPAIYLSGRIDALATRGFSSEQKAEYYRKVYSGDLEKSEQFQQKLKRNTPLFLSLTALVCGVGAGSYFLLRAHGLGPLATLEVAVLRANQRPPSHYVAATGYALLPATLHTTRKIDDSTFDYFYIPFVAEAAPARSNPLQVIVEVREKWRYREVSVLAADRKPLSIKGVLTRKLPGGVANRFRANGWLIPENVWLLEDRQSPEEYRMMGLAILTVAGGLGALGVSSILLARRFRKTTEARTSPRLH